jgi:cytochrome c biogenesis protein
MLNFFSSVKLTLTLLLLLAVISIGGTVTPVEAQRYELYYQNLWFRILLGLLALNLICCTLKSLPRKWHYRRQLQDGLNRLEGGEALPVNSLEELASKLSAAGYRLESGPDHLLAERGSFGRWGSTLVHVAILLIMLGGILGETGFVGTLNTYLQQPNHRYFDWDVQREQELGFQFRADAFRLRYYPIQLRFELIDTVTGLNHGQLVLYDNEHFEVPGSPFAGQLRGFDPEARLLTIDVLEQGKLIGQYLVGEEFEQFGAERHPRFRLIKVAFRDPVLKQMEAEVSVLEDGQVVKQGTIRVNEPLTHRGVSFYQIAYGADKFGNRSVGFQLSKDPGEGLVWFATVLLMLGFTVAFLVPRRAIGVKEIAGNLHLYPLIGWRGEGGQQRLKDLKKQLCE